MHYIITKAAGKWTVNIHGQAMPGGIFPSKKAAMMTARLLAGRAGTVTVR